MSDLSEEEIIETLQRVVLVNNFESFSSEGIIIEAIQGLLDLYNKEKEKNKELQKELDVSNECETALNIALENSISKDKIKEKIKELYVPNKETLYTEEYDRKLYASDILEELLGGE